MEPKQSASFICNPSGNLMCQFGSASQFAAQQNLRRRSITTFWAFLIIQGKQRSLSIQQSESHIKDEARVIKLCNDGHMGNTLYCPTTRKIGPFVLDFTVCLVYEKNTWSLFLPLAVVVIQKSITFIDYVKGGQLPRMLHFVYRVLCTYYCKKEVKQFPSSPTTCLLRHTL